MWCSYCLHQVEPNPAEMAERYGAEATVPDWAKRLVCRECGSRNVSFVGSGSKHDLLAVKRILGKIGRAAVDEP